MRLRYIYKELIVKDFCEIVSCRLFIAQTVLKRKICVETAKISSLQQKSSMKTFFSLINEKWKSTLSTSSNAHVTNCSTDRDHFYLICCPNSFYFLHVFFDNNVLTL